MTDVWRFYQRHADTWDRERSYPRPLMERPYLDAVRSSLQPNASVLDLGCGAGQPIARYFIEHGYGVTGVDAAPAMIALARPRFPQATWIEADMRGLSLGRRFDAIIAWDSFFHLDQDEQRAMFPVFERHIAPAGVLLFTSGPKEDAKFGTMYGEDLFHASLDPDEYCALLDATGFRVLQFVPEDPKCGGHTVWLAQVNMLSALGAS
jgi:SAM-dependent methyltransferase